MPELATELPYLMDEIRRIFTVKQIGCYLDVLECSFLGTSESEEDCNLGEAGVIGNPVLGAEKILRFARIKEMLQAEV
jgi:hypothetical protein